MTALVAPDPRRFRARTLPLDRWPAGDVDPVAVVTGSADGFLLQGRRGWVATAGVATRLHLPGGLHPATAGTVVGWLAAVPTADPLRRAASGPLAVGAQPFAPGQPAALVVPAVTVVCTASGRAWATVVDPLAPGTPAGPLPEAAAAELLAAVLRQAAPDGLSDRSSDGPSAVALRLWPDGAGFERAVAEALRAIAAGGITKVVLARQVEAEFDRAIDQAAVLRRLRRLEPACAVFADRTGDRAFLGASPELLVRRRGDTVVSHPLAGTAPARPPAAAAARLATAKEQAEHRAAADAVAERLAPWCVDLERPDHPGLVRLSSVVHLGSRMVGRLRPITPGGPGPESAAGTVPDALTLAAALHPTPAVAGVPTDRALAVIEELEPQGRGTYAGPVGWVDARGDGDMVVAIRSATVDGHRAVAHAGAGVVDGSDPHRELEETTLKLRTALGALGLAVDADLATAAAG